MEEETFRNRVTVTLDVIQGLLGRSVETLEEDKEIEKVIRDLEKKRTETTSNLLEYTAVTNTLAEERTGMAKERTALVREQTRLSTRSTELSGIRTELSRERSSFAGQRTDLSVLRTDLSRSRTGLAEQRNRMANTRTLYSEKRNNLAHIRTIFSNMRTSLARGRTDLALIRTGLAFLSLSVAFFRMFGISWWSVFDGALGVGSLVMTFVGLIGYFHSSRVVKSLEGLLPADKGSHLGVGSETPLTY